MSSEQSESAWQVELDRRKSSTALCATCKHAEKSHGTHTGACLKKIGGRFDGSHDQVRCRCKLFVASDDEQPDTLVHDLLRSIVEAQGKKLMAQDARLSALEQKVKELSHMVG